MPLRLEFTPPLAWDSLLAYLRLRAIPGVESADAAHYRRTADIQGRRGWIVVSLAATGSAVELELSPSLTTISDAVTARVQQLLDLGAAPAAVAARLSQDAVLAPMVRRLPGLRVPGAFDGFELAVRAVLGQQVSVKSATTLAGRWARTFGTAIETPYPELTHLSPTASRMASSSVDEIGPLGIIGSRARCIVALAAALEAGTIALSRGVDVQSEIANLLRLPGVGPWTAQYIAMRALHCHDAFPGTDLMLLRAAGTDSDDLERRAEAWRPWRAYATHYLWQSLAAAP